ncbi:MAG: 4Fe-4S binding protein, partial [Thermoleophilia bacterium]|nr:4Fe-4S binding protein [Thermoleophilia bacterium]
ISLYASADKCRDCRACISACPTQAMRVRGGRPSVLEHLCIDCARCIAACSSQALVMRDEVSSLDALSGKEQMLLVVPPALLAGCGPDYTPAQVLAALQGLGFADVITSEPYEAALRDAGADAAASAKTGEPGSPARPVLVPSCPAIVNLIELRFPSLVPHLAPFDSPWEAVQAAHADRPVAYVASCPSQRSALLMHASAPVECIAPEVVRQAAMVRLTGGATAAAASATAATGEVTAAAQPSAVAERQAAAQSPTPAGGLLTVTGIDHVIAVLEEIEDGLLEDVDVIEPYACDGGCFGSPLLAEDHHVAARRWDRGRAAVETAVPSGGTAITRRRAFAPRPGIRLDSDMARAIEKLGRMQTVIQALPGRDCGACGAPTCAALAEDIVMERAGMELCPYITPPSGEKEAQKP